MGREACADDGTEGEEADDRKKDDAGGEFACAPFSAEGVAEDVPAETSEGGELGAALGDGPGLCRPWLGGSAKVGV